MRTPLLATVALMATGCAYTITVNSSPPGSTLTFADGTQTTGPIDREVGWPAKDQSVTVSDEDRESFTVDLTHVSGGFMAWVFGNVPKAITLMPAKVEDPLGTELPEPDEKAP